MNCPCCGAQIPDAAAVCPYCETRVRDDVVEVRTVGQTQSATSGQNGLRSQAEDDLNMSGGVARDPLDDPRGMKWFKFLIYFLLFADAAYQVFSGVMSLINAGSGYGYYYPGLKTLVILYGIALLGLAGFTIFVRMRLAKFRRNGPKLLYIQIGASIALFLLLVFCLSGVTGFPVGELTDVSDWISALAEGALLYANCVYFGKRADLFVND